MEGGTIINSTPSASGVTTFANEACESVDILSNFKIDPIPYSQPDLQDLKAYFQRPRLVSAGSVAFGVRGRFYNLTIDGANAAFTQIFPQWANRLSGVYGIRFKLNFTLQVAATAFHQGLIAMAWQYNYEPASAYIFDRGARSCSVTNLPHVRLDIAETTMAELAIPFCYPKEFWPVGSSNFDFALGMLSLNTILPCQSVAGISAPSYKLYAYLTEVELFGADNNTSTSIVLQSGGPVSIIGQEVKKNHLLSNGLAGMSKAASFVAKNIPSLSSIAGPVAWAADTASGIARYFGYSRPLVQDAPLRVISALTGGETNVDVPMSGFAVGLFQGNTLAVDPSFGGTDVDEMALAYVAQQYSQVCVGAVNNAVHGTVVYASPVTPSALWFRAPGTAPYCNRPFPRGSADLISQSGNAFQPSSVMYISSFFRLWRGSFKFRITFAKTKLHGGRYMISYNPKFNLSVGSASLPMSVDGPETTSGLVQPYGYSMIMDLKDGNVFEFEVPYLAEMPYTNFESNVGAVSIVCMDPLQSTATVTSVVPFLVEVKAGSDYELADYAGPYFLQHASGTIYEQSGSVVTATKESSHTTIGEKVTSLKQMIMSPFWCANTVAANFTAQVNLPPWYTSYTYNQTNALKGLPNAPNTADTGKGGACAGGCLSKLYVWVKGSTDTHVYPSVDADALTLIAEQIPASFAVAADCEPTYRVRPYTSGTPKVVSSKAGPLHVRSPAFQLFQRLPSTLMDYMGFKPFGFLINLNNGNRSHFDQLTIVNDSDHVATVMIARAAGDDAAMAHYIGPLPIFIPNNASLFALESDWFNNSFS